MAGEQELGCGVSVRQLADGMLLVTSRTLELPLAVPQGAAPGTAVDFADELWEVAAAPPGGAPQRWTLRPWPSTQVIRGGVRLDAAAVAAWQQQVADDSAAERRRTVLLPLLPLLGLVPGRIQTQWHNSWAFPATAATVSSALAELILGGFGTLALAAAAFGGPRLLPPGLGWLALGGPPLLCEGMARFIRWASTGEPVGAVIGLPLELVVARPVRLPPPLPRPELVAIDDDSLVLRSAVSRRDWSVGDELRFRDRWWRLAAVNADGTAWSYRFEVAGDDEDAPGERLTLAPPGARAVAGGRPVRAGLGFVPLLIGTTMALFASPGFLRRWCPLLGLQPRAATILGASIELVGALLNLAGLATGSAVWLILVDIAVFLDGGTRFAMVLIGGGGVGSILGRPFESPVHRWLIRCAGAPPAE